MKTMAEACDMSGRPDKPEYDLAPDEISELFRKTKTIAIIGLSSKPHRDSYMVGKYLKDHGYEIIPVHPNISEWDGQKVYKSLSDVPGPVDVVDVFRRADAIGELTPQILEKKPKAVWFQLGIVNNEEAARIHKEGIKVAQNRCMKIEHAMLNE